MSPPPPPIWGQLQEEHWLLQYLPILTNQETWYGPSLNMALDGYLKAMKKRRHWWPDVDKPRLEALVRWMRQHNPTIHHYGGTKYELRYPAVVPYYEGDADGDSTVFPIIYRD